jgi:beta-glucosidase-like glycosyl hydrolase
VPSEDPYVNGEFGAAFAGALQGEGDASVLRVLATLKHGTAYDMENSDGKSRSSFNAVVSSRDLAEFARPARATQRAWAAASLNLLAARFSASPLRRDGGCRDAATA